MSQQDPQGTSTSRRQILISGLRLGLGGLLVPLKGWSTGFNTGAFWKRKAAASAGQLWAVGGGNALGRLGDGTIVAKSSPVQCGSLATWISSSGTTTHSLGIQENGSLWAWGEGTSGRLGLGNLNSVSSPVQVGSLTTWSQVSAGYGGHTLAVKKDGTLWAWGYGSAFQIGTNGFNRSSPVQIGTLTDWKQVSAGGYYSLALKTDGTIWSWGANNYGSNGLGTGTGHSSPTQIGSLTTWAKISAGYEHALAIKTDGTLWAWGNNSSGQLGDGTAVAKSSPIQIGSLNTWSYLGAGLYHSIAIKNDGTMWGWGENYTGQAAGRSLASTPSSPVQIGTLTTWKQAQGAYAYTVALKTDGTLWSWGDNSYGPGQLGSGTTTNRTSPVQVGTLTKWMALGTGTQVLPIRSP